MAAGGIQATFAVQCYRGCSSYDVLAMTVQ
jgi:hypothetical protein